MCSLRMWVFSALAPAVAAVHLNQPQMGPVLVPGMLRQRKPAPEALTMITWASLKEAMDKIGSQVREVLLVRNDIALLQNDLVQQEDTWHQAEASLQHEVAGLEARNKRLEEKVSEGAKVRQEVKSLRENIALEKERAYASQQFFSYEEAQAQLEERRLQSRVDQLRARLAEVKKQNVDEVREAQDAEVEAVKRTAEVEREAARRRDVVADERAGLKLEENLASDKTRDLQNKINGMRLAMEQMKKQLAPPGQVEAQVAAMRAEVEMETKAIAEVEAARLREEAECDGRKQKVSDVLRIEMTKELKREAEKNEVCDSTEQRKVLLEAMVKESCGPAAAAS